MKRRIAKKKAKKTAAEATQKAARQRETAMAADLAETYDRLMETEDRLLQARKEGRELKVQLAFTKRKAAWYLQRLVEYRENWVRARKQAHKNIVTFLTLGAVIGAVTGFFATLAALEKLQP